VAAVSAIAVFLAVTAALVVSRLGAAVPGPALTAVVHREVVGSGVPPALPWPSVGQGAVSVPGAGVLVQSGAERPVPVASLTKIMTAYIVLRDHPVAPTASGPSLTMGPVDVAEAARDAARNDTSVPVQVGERLTERQLLNGLMVHSANNFADTLARWDAGSIPGFVAKMNAEAAALGMTSTHYVDADGVHAGSVSTAADQLRLVARAMTIPTFAAVVDQQTITEPLTGLLANYVQAVGTDGVIGVKSGFTQAAMGCVVLAADRTVDGRRVLVLAAVTGQRGFDALGAAQSVALRLIDRAAAALRLGSVVPAGAQVATVRTRWGGGAPASVVVAPKPVTLLEWPGTTVVWRVVPRRRLSVPLAAGAPVGTLVVSDGTERVVQQVHSRQQVGAPPAAWRLWR
jgi:D-alanyl-D-alanine carboxypeptidase (penicillin-binding protein 5/6)